MNIADVLSLEELELLQNWHDAMYSSYAVSTDEDQALLAKIKQAISDKELTKNDLNF